MSFLKDKAYYLWKGNSRKIKFSHV